MPAPSTKGVVRDILSANIDLPADEAIKRAKARGVTAPEASVREAVHKVRSDLKRSGAKPAPTPTAPKPAAAPKPTAAPAANTSAAVRSILSTNLDMTADEVVRRARARGVTAPESSIRNLVYTIRSELRKKVAKPAPAPVAARTTAPRPSVAPAPTKAPTSSPAPDLSGVLANVALVNTVVGAAGGVEQARQVAEAVRACGGVEQFLQHLDLVAGIRGGTST